ncbi:MAG: efflux RND transporter periplasmic adaptor subunit [Gammaproteobacteria bacterium]|nr:efflux RND transporter periplasmic adaptor subunit [Gammaproteobacteria bacterium]
MGKRTGYLVAIAFIAGAVGLAAVLVSLAPEPDTHEPPSQIPYVDTARIVAGTGPIPVRGAGTVRPSAEVDIAPQVGGRVVWVDGDFVSGRHVEAGQVLFRVEEADYEFRVREAEAALAARQVALLEAREDAAIAQAEYERYAQRQPENASGEPNPLTLHIPQLKAAHAALAREEAALAQAKLALSRTRVAAPFDGVVHDESVDVGQLVTPGQSVGRLYSSDAVEVVVSLSDADAALIPRLWQYDRESQPVVAVVFAEYGDVAYAWRGYVDRADASLDAETRTIDVIVHVPDPFAPGVPAAASAAGQDTTPPLLLGKFVEVAIEGSVPVDYFRVRRAALRADDEIWVVRDDGTVRVVPVRVLQRIDDDVYVTGELEGGQLAVTNGIRFATDGMAVRAGEARRR